MEDFVTWLTGELNKRGWSNSELARRAGVTHTAISMVINKRNNPGPDMCVGIARAFKIPPELVFRYAGLLPSVADGIEGQALQLYDRFKNLSPQAREDVIQYVTFRYQQEQKDAP